MKLKNKTNKQKIFTCGDGSSFSIMNHAEKPISDAMYAKLKTSLDKDKDIEIVVEGMKKNVPGGLVKNALKSTGKKDASLTGDATKTGDENAGKGPQGEGAIAGGASDAGKGEGARPQGEDEGLGTQDTSKGKNKDKDTGKGDKGKTGKQK